MRNEGETPMTLTPMAYSFVQNGLFGFVLLVGTIIMRWIAALIWSATGFFVLPRTCRHIPVTAKN